MPDLLNLACHLDLYALEARTEELDGIIAVSYTHLKNLRQRLIAVVTYVFVNVFGGDYAAVAQRDSDLFLHEFRLGKGHNSFVSVALYVQQSCNYSALYYVFGNDFFDVVYGNVVVAGALGIYDHNGSVGAETETARHNDLDFVFQTLRSEFGVQGVYYVVLLVGGPAGASADQNVTSYHVCDSPLFLIYCKFFYRLIVDNMLGDYSRHLFGRDPDVSHLFLSRYEHFSNKMCIRDR